LHFSERREGEGEGVSEGREGRRRSRSHVSRIKISYIRSSALLLIKI
jgi:hypothetical protein